MLLSKHPRVARQGGTRGRARAFSYGRSLIRVFIPPDKGVTFPKYLVVFLFFKMLNSIAPLKNR